MTARLGPNSYGKSRVRMVKVSRDGARHTVRELSVDVALEGDFEAIHCRGDNSKCLPTDTMKNTVYALGKDHPIKTIESFAVDLGEHFVSQNPQVTAARVHVEEAAWDRVRFDGKDHPHCFMKGSGERSVCEGTVTQRGASVASGLEDLVILKSADSGFAGYIKDKYTTLPETDDRICATSVSARWEYTDEADWDAARAAVRGALIETFAGHKSRSVQETLFAMGEGALNACAAVARIRLSLPNKHCLLVNLKPFGLDNRNEIFVPTDEPHGLIEATIVRQ